ncbi:hypothetical protein D3C76_1678850 [compost metagenome]
MVQVPKCVLILRLAKRIQLSESINIKGRVTAAATVCKAMMVAINGALPPICRAMT